MEWNDETIASLRVFWAEGHSTAEIGRRMGVSKNAVVGKAHRLNLTARPSPIRRDPDGAPPRAPAPRRAVGPTLPPLTASVSAAASPPPDAPVHQEPAPVPVVERAPERPVVVRPVVARAPRTSVCCWPIGEPGTRSFRFCDAEATSGKPYCTAHASLAYVKVRDRREEAA